MKIGMTAAAALFPIALMLTLLLGSGVATAADVMVKDNGTALRSGPAGDAGATWKVNSGFTLTVVEEQGDWLKVQSSQLPEEDQDLWVRADQVAPLGGGEGATSAATDTFEKPIGYRVELTGTPGLKFKLECRTLREGHVSFRPHYNKLPKTYEYSGDPLACVVWKKQHHGELQISLVEIHPSKERTIGRAATQDYPASIFARSRAPDYPTSIFARSNSPWGPAAVVNATHDNFVLPPSASAGP